MVGIYRDLCGLRKSDAVERLSRCVVGTFPLRLLEVFRLIRLYLRVLALYSRLRHPQRHRLLPPLHTLHRRRRPFLPGKTRPSNWYC